MAKHTIHSPVYTVQIWTLTYLHISAYSAYSSLAPPIHSEVLFLNEAQQKAAYHNRSYLLIAILSCVYIITQYKQQPGYSIVFN